MHRNTQSAPLQFIYVMVLALSCTAAQASEWWSVGAYSIVANAGRESNRLNAESGLATIISRSGDLHRIVLQKEDDPDQQKADLKVLGLEPWTLEASQVELGDHADEMAKQGSQTSAIASEPVASSSSMEDEPAPEPAYEMSPPKAGEKLRDYCVNRANKQERAVYCTNDVFNRVASAQAKANNQSEADNLLSCALLADGAERRAQCDRP